MPPPLNCVAILPLYLYLSSSTFGEDNKNVRLTFFAHPGTLAAEPNMCIAHNWFCQG